MHPDQIVTDRRRVIAVAAGAVAAAALGARLHAGAQDATPEGPGGPPMPPLPEGAVVVADGLWNPSGVLVGPDGTVYISESGVAGGTESGTDEPTFATPNADGSLPAGPAALVLGQITILSPAGERSVAGVGLDGAVGMALVDEQLYVSCGGASVGSGYLPNPIENTISVVDLATGEATTVATPGEYEVANNPDGTDINPNLYGMTATPDGMLLVCDAGGNAIYQVDPATGDVELFATVPPLEELTGATPEVGVPARQSVPTAVVVDADGTYSVLLLGIGFWPGPSVLTYTPDGEMTPGPTGLSTAVCMAVGPDGLLYVTQLSDDFSGAEPAPGSVRRITADGAIETVAEGMLLPHGIAFDPDGSLYVTVNSLISGPDAPLGMVIRIDGVAAPARPRMTTYWSGPTSRRTARVAIASWAVRMQMLGARAIRGTARPEPRRRRCTATGCRP